MFDVFASKKNCVKNTEDTKIKDSSLQKRTYPHIDSIRTLAVSLVVLLHLDITYFSGGYVGVDIFFVISGFLITKNLKREIEKTGTICLSRFFCKRLRRLCPALLVLLVFTIGFSIILLPPAKFEYFGDALRSVSLFKANLYFKQQNGYFDTLSQLNPLAHTWSLAVEMQFYIIWSLFIFILIKTLSKKISYNFLLWLFTGIIFVYSLMANLSHFDKPNSLYYYINFRLFEFAIGALTVWFFENWRVSYWQKDILCLLGFVAVFYAAISFDGNTTFPSYNALIPALGAAFLILGGSAKYIGLLLRNRLICYLGIISYSIYLIHWPLIAFVKQYHTLLVGNPLLSFWDKIAIVFATLGLASLLYHLVEFRFTSITPLTKKLQRQSIIKWIGLLIIFFGLGVAINKPNLWKWRLKKADAFITFDKIRNYHKNNFGGRGVPDHYQVNEGANDKLAVILGDSHAAMLLTGFYELIAKPYAIDMQIISGRSALMLPGITVNKPNEQKKYDLQINQIMSEVVSSMDKADNSVLFLSQYWLFQLNRSRLLSHHQSLNINMDNPYKYINFYKISAALDQLHRIIKNKKMVLIGDVSGSQVNMIECIMELKWFNSNTFCPVKTNQTRDIKRINVNKMLDEYARTHSNVYFIDPDDVLCEKGYCFNLSSKKIPLYSDTDHLSKTGSRFFIKALKERIISFFDKGI